MNNSKTQYYFYDVWDQIIRVLHWWNVLTLSFQVISGSIILIFGSELKEVTKYILVTIHFITGYMFAGGLFTRIIWLFIGPNSASWKDLLPLTLEQRKIFVDTIKYYLNRFRGSPPLYIAHNPFAGVIYAVFFLIAGITVVTGTILLNLPQEIRREFIFITLHKFGYYLIMLYIIAHVSAVFIHELVERHNIISAMVHGKKTFTEDELQILNVPNPAAEDSGK